ncbi:MAG TPA: LLM class flavin-dependent oxidoreductase [Myxococcota bacterium]|jgi:alkanesulfonate monooxygenase SsuD/methylene tetrahydromethanopterin reductase-like flavin-dependent oxidoreductase (luciferase family)
MREGLLILGDHLPNPHTGVKTTPAARHRQIVELGVRAEALGFDSVWLGEHHLCDYILSSPPVVLAAIGERTTRLRLGTGVTLLGSLDPVRAAEDYATVDALSSGRVEVVAGRGVLQRTYADFGHDPKHSRELFEENVAVLLAAWSEAPTQFEATHRPSLRGVTVHPRPTQTPHPPLWIGGGSSFASVDLAARLGLPLMLPSVLAPPAAFAPYVARYRERFVANGVGRERAVVGACSHVHVAVDSQRARERWRPYHTQYLHWVSGVLIPWGVPNLGFGEERAAGPPPPAPNFDAMCAGPSICGSASEVTDRIAAMRESLGLDVHLAMFDHGGIPEAELADALERFARDVMPALARA